MIRTLADRLRDPWIAALVAVALLAVAPRLVAAARMGGAPTTYNDAGWYVFYGQQIAHGHGYVDPGGVAATKWPPGYPYFLGAVFKATGDSLAAARFLQAALGVLTVVLVAALGRRLFSASAGIAAAACCALLPSLIAYTGIMLSETLISFLLVLASLLFVSGRTAAMVAAGCALGAAMLVRSEAVVLLVPLVAWSIVAGRWARAHRLLAARQLAAMLLAAAAVIAPWWGRNIVVARSPQPISHNLGLNLYVGNNPDATGAVMNPDVRKFDAEVVDLSRPERDVRFDALLRNAALRYAAAHPLTTLRRVPGKLRTTFASDDSATAWYEPLGTDYLSRRTRGAIDAVSQLGYAVLVVLAAAGAGVAAMRRERGAVLPLAVCTMWALLTVVFFGDARFHVPILPFFALLAGLALDAALAAMAPRFARADAGEHAVPSGVARSR